MHFGTDLDLFNALDEGVVATDPLGCILFVNPAAERMFGRGTAELVGQPLDVVIPEGSREAHRRHVEDFRQSGARSRMMGQRSGIQGRRGDGSVFEAEASISRSRIGGSEVLLAIIRDVSARKAEEARLLASEQKHRAILDTCSDAILLADADSGRITEVNPQAAALFGCSMDDLLGRHQSELHPLEDRRRLSQAFREHLEIGRVLVPDATIQRDDGTVVPVEITARPTRIGGVRTLVGFFRDVTHHRERERELIEAREAAMAATRSKTTFLANISHELRTPLNAVIGMSEMIGGEFFGPAGHPKYAEYGRDIRDSGSHLLDIINDILDLSRLEMGKLVLHETEVDLAELVDLACRTMAPLIEENGLVCTQRVTPEARRLHADRRAVRQMLLNLLSNAVKHTPAGGRVTVIATCTGSDGEVTLSVADTGRGIDPERLADVTQPFNSGADPSDRGPGGTGLGLAITKGLIERHGGRLEIAGRSVGGTSVRLVFPGNRARPDRGEAPRD
ncbi:PAS domain S-box protein [Thalassobaculum sp.]|uniref:sensor histidine kinase n=1 Tax=Thalassobaculum sp. TaxID=2022740 RepID=UPI0032EAA220